MAFKRIKYTHSLVSLKKKKYIVGYKISINIIRISDSEYTWVVTVYKLFLLTIFQCWLFIKYYKKVTALEHTLYLEYLYWFHFVLKRVSFRE